MMTSSNGYIFRTTGHLCGNSPHKGQWRGALMFSLICAQINHWVNNDEAGDLRCYNAHYDVTVMSPWDSSIQGLMLIYWHGHYKKTQNSLSLSVMHFALKSHVNLSIFIKHDNETQLGLILVRWSWKHVIFILEIPEYTFKMVWLR